VFLLIFRGLYLKNKILSPLFRQIVLAGTLFFSLFIATAWAVQPIPDLRRRVTDLTNTLSSTQQNEIENVLISFEKTKGSQIVVLIVPTVRPEAIEEYAIRVADQWKIGRKGVDDGVLLLVAKDDRELRIEVGRGLEGVLPDATSKRVIDEFIVPKFKSGNFYGGIQEGIAKIMSLVQGEPLPSPVSRSIEKSLSGRLVKGPIAIVLVVVALSLQVVAFKFGRVGKSFLSALGWGLLIAVFFSVFFGFIFAFISFLGSLSGPNRRGGFFTPMGGGGSGFGGGGFSGGGASGRW